MKKSQVIMVWILPLVLIGGIFYPLLGYLALAMMVFLLILSFFRGRYWCWNLCPRGAFLDIVLSKLSRNKPVPKIFTNQRFRWMIFVLFMTFLIIRLLRAGQSLIAIGIVFVTMCLITTIISVILGAMTKHRAWCIICPMGTLQDKIGKLSKAGNREKK